MDGNLWIFAIPFLWIAAVITASVLFRRSKGKPIFPRLPDDAAFSERGCSGRSLGGVLSRIGGASRCLMVVVRDKQLVVTPQFPFNLMFLPEIYGLDIAVPITSITGITPITSFFRKALRIEFSPNGPADMELVVRDEAGFTNAIGREVARLGSRDIVAPTGTKKPRRLIAMRVFLAIWGVGALFAATTGFQEDWRFRQEGAKAVATYVNPDQQIDGQVKMGVLTYAVAGTTHRLTSLNGIGLFKVGDQTTVYYLPSNPEEAREEGYFHFDLLWLGLGILALSISIFGGLIARRIW